MTTLDTLKTALLARRGQSYITEFDAFFEQLVDDVDAIGARLVATSTTEATIGTGAQSLTVQTEKLFAAGMYVIAYQTSTPANWMIGVVDSYTTSTGVLTFTVASGDTGGSGTITAWTVAISSRRGATGATGGIAGGTLTGNLDADGNDITGIGALSAATASITALGANLNAGGFQLSNFGHMTANTGSILTSYYFRAYAGDQWRLQSAGTVTTGQTIGVDSAPCAALTLGANLTITFGSPATGFSYWKYLILTQDGVGGRDVTWAGPGGYTVQWPNNDEPDWASQDPATETIVIARVGFRASTVDLFVGD